MIEIKPKKIYLDIESEGLSPWYGDRVTCICAKDSDGNLLEAYAENVGYNPKAQDFQELDLINRFDDWIGQRIGYQFITKNGKGFDIPFILTRNAILSNCGADWLTKWPHIDLQELTNKRISLSDMAQLLRCKRRKSGTGENAIKLWQEKRYDELVAYCMDDVLLTEEVYLRWLKLGEIEV